ncbi:MAG: hypothetical protein ABH856_04680 [Patescibacteria group bacterium]|nr:hypothetical protein [Patescibacteria group bacterium]
MEDLEKEIAKIKARNRRVEADKAWEVSWTRKILVLTLTYLVISIFFLFAKIEQPFINSIVPALAFVLSTLSLSVFKKVWIKLKR